MDQVLKFRYNFSIALKFELFAGHVIAKDMLFLLQKKNINARLAGKLLYIRQTFFYRWNKKKKTDAAMIFFCVSRDLQIHIIIKRINVFIFFSQSLLYEILKVYWIIVLANANEWIIMESLALQD